MPYQIMTSALDGPEDYKANELTQVHRGRGMTANHFASSCGHFADAAEQAGADKLDIENAQGRSATDKDKMTRNATADG